ncbi:MAG: tRNA pseudouridine(55) synthase TruB [Eubacteriales bacterium]|nr:tRNA pseudouridine(55) synthase TruB [Eubacteriales bacterium]
MNGILLVDKPSGWTSSDVVIKLKGILHQRRIGHSGTLDPMATGLLVIFVGRATRAVEFAEAHSKRYIAALRLGDVTDTQDITGNVISHNDVDITQEQLETVLSKFKGDIVQIPPMYSAVKVNGQRLYKIARSGGEVERRGREINLSDISVIGKDGEDYILDVSCSKGTYIRTLCNDIGASLGCGGCMNSLRRIRAGEFSVENAHTLDEIKEKAAAGEAESLLLPVDSLFSYAGKLRVGEDCEKRIRTGTDCKVKAENGEYRVYSESGEFLMLGRVENGILKTVKSFFEV